MKSLVIHFPWGAAGNLVKNIITLDTRFEFPYNGDRYNYLLDYYQEPVQSESWLKREWQLRTPLYNKYYKNNCIINQPGELAVAYDNHGGAEEVATVLSTEWITNLTHIFLLPTDLKTITEIYNSKNPTINQLEHEGDLSYRQKEALTINTTMTRRLRELANELELRGNTTHYYIADHLYKNTDVIVDIVKNLDLDITKHQIETIHSIWLQSTRELYYNYFKRELPL